MDTLNDRHQLGHAKLPPLSARDIRAISELAQQMRMSSWDIAVHTVETAIEQEILPALRPLGTIKRLANLPAFIGALATALVRPRPPHRKPGSNPVLTRLARDHVIEREALGFTARQTVQEFLLLRRVLWKFVQSRASMLDTNAVLVLEDNLNSVLDDVIAECTVTYFERATHELTERSRHDGLTELLNHQAFHARIDQELERSKRYGHELQVVYFDLDDFKLINDTLGHPIGDSVLRNIAHVIRESIRETDFAGRMGGDEFVICIVESNELAAALLLDRIAAAISERIAEGVVPPTTGLSAGIASFPDEADNARDLLAIADRRLYETKRARKGIVDAH